LQRKADWNNSKIIKDNPAEEIAKLKEESGKDIRIAGSSTLVKSLLVGDHLIDEYRFLIHLTIMGSRKRFFKDGMNTTKLKRVETKLFSSGAVLLRFQPMNC
jgi:dihydrofolate reductase